MCAALRGAQLLAFSTEAVGAVVDSYLPLVRKHRDDPYTEQQKEWQQMRRCGAVVPALAATLNFVKAGQRSWCRH